jgi:2-dehydro-3-deoxyphosphogluconate aldolase/(4S)-4-hydroxy-2-oxoglutarate aldolase
MDYRNKILSRLIDSGIVAVIRLDNAAHLTAVAEALHTGGVDCIEFTMTTPGALRVLEDVAGRFGADLLLGAGTVLDPETARAAILAGADFVVGPTVNKDMIRLCHRYDKVVIPGAMTPTEICTAWECGADIVKLFPAGVLGPGYLKDVLGPLPQVRLLPTGGVRLDNVAAFVHAGAVGVAVGGELVDRQAVKDGRFEVITSQALKFMETIQAARAERT